MYLRLPLLDVDCIVHRVQVIAVTIYVISATMGLFLLMVNVLLASLDAMFAAIKI